MGVKSVNPRQTEQSHERENYRLPPGKHAAYVISTNDLNPSWMLLYGGTFALQFVCALLRGIFAYAFLWLALRSPAS